MDDFHSGINYVSHSNIELSESTSDRVVGSIIIEPHHHQPYGVVHGGVYCTLVETLASTGAAIWAMEGGMVGCVGVHNSTNFLRAVTEGVIIGVARPIHRGRTQQLWQVDVTLEETEKLVATGQVRLQNITDPAVIGR